MPPVSDHVRRDSLNAQIKERLKDVDDELGLVIVKDMMLTGYDSPPLHTPYLGRPLKGALLMQTLARVNRTFRGKEDGLLLAYAPLAENLAKALGEYTRSDQDKNPVGKNIDEAVGLTVSLVDSLPALLAGYDWKSVLMKGGNKAFLNAVNGAVSHLLSPGTPGNQPSDGEESLAAKYRRFSSQLSRAWALCLGSETLSELRPEIQVYEEIRVWMAKYDAADRQASGEPVPEDIQRLLGELIASANSAGEVLDIYEAAGMPKPSLDHLTPEFIAKTSRRGTRP
ncbi:hypothetical protein BJG92_03402 [Arthrobacter sp. SO5]|nr:hypothetical protein [Arthrobacter sp. SO5]